METNKLYKYREIAGEYYLIPVGSAAKKNAAPIRLTETAAWIWKQIESDSFLSPELLAAKLANEYEVDTVQAQVSVNQFLFTLYNQGLLK